MKILVTRNTFIGGVLVQASADPIEVDAVVGKQLIGLGKAVAVVESPAAPVEPVAVETVTESAPVEPTLKKGKGK
jgi:hypothetical protein